MKQVTDRGRFAERVLHGVDSNGDPETVVIWIERKEGGVWAVGRAVNPDWRSQKEPRPEDYVFEGYELGDCLQEANETLEDDFTVSERDGHGEHVRPFTRDELLKPLEKWFFGRAVKLTFGFTPCPNDAFAFHALVHGLVPAPFEVEPVLLDIEELNRRAADAELQLTKLSFGAAAAAGDRYRLLRSGAALGHGVGPLVVAREAGSLEEAAAGRIAVPGRETTAFLLLRLAAPALGDVVELALRPDPRRGRRRRGGCGPDHPREPLHVRRARPRRRSPTSASGGRARPAFPSRWPGSSRGATSSRSSSTLPRPRSAPRSSTRSRIPRRAATTSARSRRRCRTRSARRTSRST